MSIEEWELFVLSKIWWIDYELEGIYSCMIHGVKLIIPYEKLHTLEVKHNKRAMILAGG